MNRDNKSASWYDKLDAEVYIDVKSKENTMESDWNENSFSFQR